MFKHAATGTQCCANCVMAVVAASTKSPSLWTTLDMNEILKQGDMLHVKTLKEQGWPYRRQECRLDVDEIPEIVTCHMGDIAASLSIGLKSEQSFAVSSDLTTAILCAVQSKPSHSFILRVHGDRNMAIICHHERYSLFDPHACNQKGETDGDGAACTLLFDTVYDMIRHIEYLYGTARPDEQVDLIPVDIEVLSKKSTIVQHVPYDMEDSDIDADPTPTLEGELNILFCILSKFILYFK